MTYQNKVDTVQREIIEALRGIGCKVRTLNREKDGLPDLLVGRHGVLRLLEVKTDKEGLTPAEKKFHDEWSEFPVYIVRDIYQAIEAVTTPESQPIVR